MAKEIGKVVHFFSKIQVAIIELSAPLKVGDTIKIKGHTTDFEQKVDSIQIEHQSVQEAKIGDAVGIKVSEHAREDDVAYLVE